MKRVSVLLPNDKTAQGYTIRGKKDPEISCITYQSRACTEDTAFVALKGTHTDGHLYIREAVEKGSPLIIHSEDLPSYDEEITYIQCEKPQLLASQIAWHLHAPYPEHIIGITGTDGKSSTALFLYRFLTRAGVKCGLLSTVGIDDGSGYRATPYRQSTPEPEILYPFLGACKSQGVRAVVLEATSHALSLKTARLAPLTFSSAVIQSISREHLDFHASLELYVDDKMNLIRQVRDGGSIITSSHHPYLAQITSAMKPSHALLTYGEEAEHSASLRYTAEKRDLPSCSFSLSMGGRSVSAETPFAPSFFLENIAAAALAAAEFTSDNDLRFLTHDALCEPIAGRYQLIPLEGDRILIIDFAHTPEAYEKLFSFIASVEPARHICALFGAAGERDRGKRAPMGKAAGTYCSRIYLSDEDSRGEELSQIFSDIEQGIGESGFSGVLKKIESREQAVRTALKELEKGEILLLLGKGHEQSIEHEGVKRAYDEARFVQSILEKERFS